MSSRSRTFAVVCASLAAVTLLTSGCATTSDLKAADGGEGAFTADDVSKGSGGRVTTPLFAVPKTHEAYTFAFLNPGLSIPTFVEWKNGMKAAAEFYGGVDLVESDLALDYPKSVSAYQTIAVRSPAVVGTGAGAATPEFLASVKKDGTKFLAIDQEPAAAGDFAWFGVDNEEVGRIGAESLAAKAKERVGADWAGTPVGYLGVSAATCLPCDARVRTGGGVVEQALGLRDDQLQYVAPADGSAVSEETAVTDYLTAHPASKVVVLAYGDGGAVGALNALAKAGRTGDGLVVSLGGDPSGRAALRDPAFKTAFVGAVDFNPFAQGWNWVEAAIALQQGKDFGTYQVERFLTAGNVDSLYPND